MIITNGNHVIIKNHFGNLNFYGKNCLFIYSKIPYSGKCTSSSNLILSFSQNERGFHGIVFGKRTISK